MQTVIRPYEVLIRWRPDGTISGAHVVRAVLVLDDEGGILSSSLLPAMPAGEAGADFPLADALTAEIAEGCAVCPYFRTRCNKSWDGAAVASGAWLFGARATQSARRPHSGVARPLTFDAGATAGLGRQGFGAAVFGPLTLAFTAFGVADIRAVVGSFRCGARGDPRTAIAILS